MNVSKTKKSEKRIVSYEVGWEFFSTSRNKNIYHTILIKYVQINWAENF